jgi:membrane-associated HD superfamily phosphohydrolase
MVLVEQGYIGLAIFLILLFYTLLRGERIYHQTKSVRNKQIVMIALLMIIVISSLQIINDLLETDKIGPFFFMAMAILVRVDVKNKKDGLAV